MRGFMKTRKLQQWVLYLVVLFIAIAIAMARAAQAAEPMPTDTALWDEWIRTQWNVEFAQGEAFIETRWLEIPQCQSNPDIERSVFAELGPFTEVTRAQAEPRFPAQALRWLLDPVAGREDVSLRGYARLRAELGRGLRREGLSLISVTHAEFPYAITRVGIWQRGCRFFVLISAMED